MDPRRHVPACRDGLSREARGKHEKERCQAKDDSLPPSFHCYARVRWHRYATRGNELATERRHLLPIKQARDKPKWGGVIIGGIDNVMYPILSWESPEAPHHPRVHSHRRRP
ncbi:MAG TPA: hypothetical protein VFQ06_10050, partial [Nitrospira sp.]|nr:hypothetical protein [Nitrospira sp.]